METKTIAIVVIVIVLLSVGIGCTVYFSKKTPKITIVPWTSQQLASAAQYFTQTANFPDSVTKCLVNDSSTRYNYDDFVKDTNAIIKTTTCMGTKGAWNQDLINFIISNTVNDNDANVTKDDTNATKACLTCVFNLIQQDFLPSEILLLDDAQKIQVMEKYMKKCKGKGCGN